MASSQVLFHCPCTALLSVSRPPPSEPPLANFHHHPLSSLLFCEECDAIRCDSCVACEISCYYCPNCLFEVPSASVRGEKNRCARNCFQCPQCCHTLSVVASDPDPSLPLTAPAASAGEAPFYLSCSFCRWDSKEVGITFEKPTGLALQLQKGEDAAPEILEFDHLKDHLEPFLRRGQAHPSHPSTSTSSVTAAASAALSSTLLKDIPGLGSRHGSLFGLASRARGGEGKGVKDDLDKYESLGPVGGAAKEKRKGKKVDTEAERMREMREMGNVEVVASLEKRWTSSWQQPILSSDLKPLRTPLQSKRSKRCPVCKHILIKPEQKASSSRFKIKLVASNYLPSIEVYRRPPPTIGSRLSAIAAGTASGMRRTPRTAIGRSVNDAGGADEEPLRPGRTYTFELSFTNPLYEPIHVRLAVARPGGKAAVGEVGQPVPPPYAVNLPSSSFPISAYAEEWEYEDDEAAMKEGMEEDDEPDAGTGASPFKKRKPRNAPGIVEKKMNRTTVMMEVAVAKETVGPVRVNMLVTYVYQSDDGGVALSSPTKSPKKGGPDKDDVKSFSFWTLFTLGTVTPRPAAPVDSRRTLQVGSGSG